MDEPVPQAAAPAAAPSDRPAPKLGLRERNKQAKERLIREAARALFVEKGFEATTLRAVADKADVGFGTVFAYANDKAGLLAMVFVEELKALPPLFSGGHRAAIIDELVEGLGHLLGEHPRAQRAGAPADGILLGQSAHERDRGAPAAGPPGAGGMARAVAAGAPDPRQNRDPTGRRHAVRRLYLGGAGMERNDAGRRPCRQGAAETAHGASGAGAPSGRVKTKTAPRDDCNSSLVPQSKRRYR